MIPLRNNKYIKDLLSKSRTMWNDMVPSLNLAQIEWRLENQEVILGIVTKTGLFNNKIVQLILLKKDDGQYILFSPASKKDKGIPCFLYDIADIDEFVKRYPIQPVYDNKDFAIDGLYDELLTIKTKPTRGFIETRKNEETEVFEIIIER